MTDLVRRGIPFGAGLRGHTDAVLWGCWGVREGRPVLATGGRDFTVRLWDPVTGQQVEKTMRGEPAVALVWGAWTGERTDLAVGGLDGRSWLWAPGATGLKPFSRAYERSTVCGGWTTLGNRQALIVVDDRGLASWDGIPASGPVDGYHKVHGAADVLWGAWSGTGRWPYAATGSADGKVHLWDLTSGRPDDMGTILHRTRSGWGAWATLNGRPVLATPGEMHSVVLWDPIRKAEVAGPLMGHADTVTWGGWGEIGGELRLATAGADRTVRIWDPATGQPVGPPLVGHDGSVTWGAWALIGDDPVLATGDAAGAVRLWDPATGEPLGEVLKTGKPSLWGAWEVVDGRSILATGGDDTTVRLFEVVDERPIGANLPNYRSDALTTVDHLERTAEATAVAELITARSARPPLAVGLFGDWGEGKSHFMAILQQRVTAAAGTHGLLAHRHVRQVRFNAWHYAETDLWASLVTELFTQLAGPESGDGPIGQRQQSRLAAELIAQRGLPQRFEAARARRDELRAKIDQPAERWSKLSEPQQQQIRTLAGEKPQRLYEDAVRAARMSWWTLRGFRWALTARVLLVLVLVAVTAGAVAWWLPHLDRWWAALPGVTLGLAVAETANRIYREVRRRGGKAWELATRFVAEQSQRLTAAADAADAEVAELQRQMRDFTAAGQLAGVIAERAASTDYRSRLDVMSRVREDFARMSGLLAKADSDPAPDEVGDELPRIDRIVIYVDDLDRCPPARVVEMLEAVHLLLAVDLFVVVVAVDPGWLLAAIKSQYQDMTNPTQYLEKIFQVVLTLPALDTAGYQRMLRGLVATRTDQDPTPLPEAASGAAPAAPAAPGVPRGRPSPDADHGVRLPRPREVHRVDPFALDPDEIRLLDLVGPPHLIATPRQAKRLANSYGLLTALRQHDRAIDREKHTDLVHREADGEHKVVYYPYRAGLVLLAVLVAWPAEGAELLKDLHAEKDPHRSWTDFLAGRPLEEPLTRIAETAAGHGLALPEPLCAWKEWIVPVGRLSFPAGRGANGRPDPVTGGFARLNGDGRVGGRGPGHP